MTSGPEEGRPPRAARGLYQRYAIAGALIVLLTTTAVATGALLKVKGVSDTLHTFGHVAAFKPTTITPADAGKPQTILLVGSDRRFGWKRGASRSDTMMLLRLDPHQEATAVMSVPRDLVVDIPGHGRDKINAAYSYGGLDLATRTIKEVLGITINHAIEVNFRGFREAVDFVGCVYTDVDRRYYHSNVGLPPSLQYAEIDLQPGYQRLCGQKALDYVRFRHADTDLVRAARQQDFVRQAKDQVGTSRLVSDLNPLIKIFAKATETDANLQSSTGILRLLKLAVFSTGHPLREIEFPHTFVNSPVGPRGQLQAGSLGSYVTATPYEISQAVDRFMHARASAKPKTTGPRHALSKAAKSQKRRNAHKPPTSWAQYGLVDARRRGEDLVAPTVAKGRPRFPVYFPAALTPTGTYPAPTTTPPAPMPRVYDIRDRGGHLHQAYRIVVVHNAVEGQYYGIQGTTWKSAPFLEHPSESRRMRGRTYELYYDGKRLRAVAWPTPRAVYWVSNTLSLELTNKQMLGTARSLTRFGQ